MSERGGHVGLWIGLSLGLPIMGWGVRGILQESARTHPAELARWIVGSALVHDLAVLPVVAAVGLLARRVASERAWPVIRWGMVTTAVIAAVAWPFVRGYGRRSSNPSLLPRDYATGTAVAIAVTWAIVGVLVVVGRWRSRRAEVSR